MKKVVKYGLVLIIALIDLFFIIFAAVKYGENGGNYKYPTTYIEEVEAISVESNLDNGYYSVGDFSKTYLYEKPNMGFVYVNDSQITKYGIYYNDRYESCVNGDCMVESYDKSKLVSVKDFGAIGDGVSDDTKAIKDAVKYINQNGGILYFPTATYLVSAEKDRDNIMEITSDKEVVIDFMGSTIILAPNNFPQYAIVKAINVTSIVVKNGILIGDRLKHGYVEGNTPQHNTHEFGVGVYFFDTDEGLAYNIESYNFTGDSMLVKDYNSIGTVTIDQCDLHHSRRQGLTIVNSDVVIVKNTTIHHIGTSDGVAGTAPKAGIDIEPDSGTFKVNKAVFYNIHVYEVDGYGLIANKTWSDENTMPTPDITVYNSIIEKPALSYTVIKNSILNFTKPTAILLGYCDIEDSIFNMDTSGSSLFMESGRVNRSIFQSLADDGEINGKIYFYGTVVTNSRFINIKGRDNVDTRSNADYGIVLFGDQGAFGDGSVNNEFYNCNIYARGDVDMDYSKLYDCVLYTSNSVRLIKVEIYGGRTLANSNATIEMINCKIINAGHFESSIKILTNCNIEVDDMPNAFGDGSKLIRSTITVKDKAMINSFLLVSSITDSVIIVEQYSNERKFDNKYISNFNKYVSYLGDKKLTYSLNS